MKSQTIEENVAEVMENGAFLHSHVDDRGRDIYLYERTGRAGKEYGADQFHEAYLLSVSGTGLATVVWSCTCPASRRMAKEGDGETCKHEKCLEAMLRDNPKDKTDNKEKQHIALSGWGLCGL